MGFVFEALYPLPQVLEDPSNTGSLRGASPQEEEFRQEIYAYQEKVTQHNRVVSRTAAITAILIFAAVFVS